jgi:hypothetical protein
MPSPKLPANVEEPFPNIKDDLHRVDLRAGELEVGTTPFRLESSIEQMLREEGEDLRLLGDRTLEITVITGGETLRLIGAVQEVASTVLINLSNAYQLRMVSIVFAVSACDQIVKIESPLRRMLDGTSPTQENKPISRA